MTIDAQEDIKRRLGMFLDNNPQLVNAYLDKFGPKLVMKYIKVIREDFAAGDGAKNILEEADDKDMPFFFLSARCPVCKKKDVQYTMMVAKSLAVENDKFGAPVYKPAGNFAFIDFNKVAVTVCHHCLFASPDKKDFDIFNKQQETYSPSQTHSSVISDLQDTMGERFSLVEGDEGAEFLHSMTRDAAAGILSYKLADLRAEVEARYEIPYSFYKRGSYWTRIALMERQRGNSDEMALDNALGFFKDAFIKSDFPGVDDENKACYIVFALNLRLGNEKEAREYMGALEKIKSQNKNASDLESRSLLASADRWLNTTKDLWERRNDKDLWKTGP